MTRFARTIDIAASPAAVWAVLVDVEQWPAWATQFERLERLEAGPLALGSRVRIKATGTRAAIWEITEFEDLRSFTWQASLGPGLRIIGGHVIRAVGDAANAEFWLESAGPLGRLMGPLLRRRIFSRNTQAATVGLKQFIEGRG